MHVVFDHRLDNVGPASQQMSDDGISALQRQVCNLDRSHDWHAFHVNVFLVELTGDISVAFVDQLEERFWRSGNRRAVLAKGCLSVGAAGQSKEGERYGSGES